VNMEQALDTVEEDVFYFDPAPVDQQVVEGGAVRLRCDVSNRRLISFYWTLNDKPVANTTRRYQDDSDLRVLHADRHLDAGSFRCVATNVSTGIALRSAQARINIFCEWPSHLSSSANSSSPSFLSPPRTRSTALYFLGCILYTACIYHTGYIRTIQMYNRFAYFFILSCSPSLFRNFLNSSV